MYVSEPISTQTKSNVFITGGKWSDSNTEKQRRRKARAAETKIAPEMSTQKQRARLFQASFNTSELSLSTVEHGAERHTQQVRRRRAEEDTSRLWAGTETFYMSFHSFNMRDDITDALFPCRRTAVPCTGYALPILQCVYMTPEHIL